MRKLSLLAAVAAVITLGACSNDTELGKTGTDNREIGFRSFIDKGAASRATITDKDNMLGFTVTGWWDREGTTTLADALMKGNEYLFNAFDITRREGSIVDWTYSPVRYWPTTDIIGGGVTFFAYSPASSKGVTTGLHNYVGDPIEYTVPDPTEEVTPNSGIYKAVEQEDFLVARTNALKESDTSGGVVELTFAHALSRVKFYARTTNTNLTYVIGGIEMIGLHKNGKLDISAGATRPIPLNGQFTYNDLNPASNPVVLWTDHSNKGSIRLDMGESPINLLGKGSDNKYHSLHGDINALMVLPQTTSLGDEAKPDGVDNTPNTDDDGFLIKVLYKAYMNNPEKGPYYAGSKTEYEAIYFRVTDRLRSVNGNDEPFTFEIGRQYNFCLEFGSEAGDPITFTVDVGNWSDAIPDTIL